MHCKSLWIKASAKCINVNVNVLIGTEGYSRTMFLVSSPGQKTLGQQNVGSK